MQIDKTLVKILLDYFNYTDVFSLEAIVELPNYTKLNNHARIVKEDKQPLYNPIYSRELVELETLKTYIKINLANGFF